MKHILVLLLYAVTLCSSCAIGGEEDSSTVIYNIYHQERIISPDPQPPAPETFPEKTEAPVPEITCSGHGGRGCNGSKNCTICKNCRYCRHCAKEGGRCGVCR